MTSRHFTVLTVIRVLLLMLTLSLLSWIFGDSRLFFNQIIVGLIIMLQVVELIRFVNLTNRELSRFLLSIKHGDFSVTFKQKPLNNSFKDLQNSMSEIIDAYKQVKIEKEAQYHFLQLLVNQIRVGIISIVNDDIILINPTAERLLHINGLKNWKLVQQLNPWI
ncbi:MAG: ATP-binding protein, partial [Marivirga sp.]|nr:ATP-binding protein [Marivirga sp.]